MAGLLKIDGTDLYYVDYSEVPHSLTGTVGGSITDRLRVIDISLYYRDYNGDTRYFTGSLTGNALAAGRLKVDGDYLCYGDINDLERRLVLEGLLLEYDGASTSADIVFSDDNYGRVIELGATATISSIEVKLQERSELGDDTCGNLILRIYDTPTANSSLPDLIASSTIANPGLGSSLQWVSFPFSVVLQGSHIYLVLAEGCEARYGDHRFRIQLQPHNGIPANQRSWRWRGYADPTQLAETEDWTRNIRVYGAT